MLISFLLEKVGKIPQKENFIVVKKKTPQNIYTFIQRTLKSIYKGTNVNTKLIRKSYKRSSYKINIVYTRSRIQKFMNPTEYICKVNIELENGERWEDFKLC